MKEQDQLSIVIPMKNEASNVENLIQEIETHVDFIQMYEIIIVDDGSTDETADILKKLAATLPQLRMIRHKKNYGQSTAIVSGVKSAKYSWIITLDGDGQNDPADIKKLFFAAKEFANSPFILVNGHREKRKDNFTKRISSKFANFIRKKLLRDDCPDSGCGMKCFRRDEFLTLPHFNHLHRFIPALYNRAQGKIINVRIHHRPRLSGVSKYGTLNRLFVGITDLFGVYWLIRRPCHAETFEDPK